MHSALQDEENTCYVSISGDVGLSDEAALKRIEASVRAAPQIAVDVGELKYADTTFLRFLLRLKSQPNKTARDAIRLVRASRRLQRLLEVTGLLRAFQLR